MKKLYRIEQGKVIGGVCGGFAEYLNIDPNVVRILYVILSVFTAAFPGILVYIICLIILPTKSSLQ